MVLNSYISVPRIPANGGPITYVRIPLEDVRDFSLVFKSRSPKEMMLAAEKAKSTTATPWWSVWKFLKI